MGKVGEENGSRRRRKDGEGERKGRKRTMQYKRGYTFLELDGYYGGVMDGSVRLLVRREKLPQDLNEYLASDLDMVHRSRLWMGSWWLRSASSTSRESLVPPAAAATTSRTSRT